MRPAAGPGGAGAGGEGNGAYLDATFLRFARDLRGIPQVILRFAEILSGDPRFAGTRFLAAPGTYEAFLGPAGVRREWVVESPAPPLAGRFERFHGLGSTFRYRRLAERPRLIIHPELRSVTRDKVPQAVCFHDFIELEDVPGAADKWGRRAYYRYKCRRAARAAFKMANSEHTRARALALFPEMDPGSIRAVPLGFRRSLEAAAERRPERLDPLKCLYVGSYEPRKNIPALLAGFIAATGGMPAELHLAGQAAPETRADLEARAREAGIASRVRWHGLVSDAELRALYAGSHVLLFPSLKEGFGLPLAEAMAHGLVVCAFRNSSIPEVVGDAGVLAGDDDFAAWGRALRGLAADPARYHALSDKARERARYFAPEAARERLAAWLGDVFRAAGIPAAEGEP